MSGLIYHSDKRRVLPKIERIDQYDDPKPSIGETVIYDVYGEPFVGADLLKSELDQWKEDKNQSKAGEIISGALVDDRLDEVLDVIDFLRKMYPNDPFIKKILANQKKDISLNDRIAKNRQQLIFEPKDALTWTDQAINYLEIKNRDKALRSIEAALSINKDNGFIVRIASRIFNLVGDTGRAIDVLKKSELYRYDPQILSAEISFFNWLEENLGVLILVERFLKVINSHLIIKPNYQARLELLCILMGTKKEQRKCLISH